MRDGLQEVMSAGAAAGRLDVSPSGLRRLAIIYSAVHGELPREPKTNNRVWPVEAVERLEQARALVEAERYHSIREGLEALERGEPVGRTVEISKALAELEPSARELLGVLIEESRAVRAELEALRSEVAASRSLPGASPSPVETAAADAPTDGPMVRAARWLERRLRGGG